MGNGRGGGLPWIKWIPHPYGFIDERFNASIDALTGLLSGRQARNSLIALTVAPLALVAKTGARERRSEAKSIISAV